MLDISQTIQTFRLPDVELPYVDTGGGGPVLHFSHANGLPVGTYEPLLRELAKTYRVVGLGHRGQLGGTGGIKSWHQLSRDLAAFFDYLDCGPIYAVGHSIGGIVSMFAAARRPELFSQLVMLDPTLLPPKIVLFIRISRLLGIKRSNPMSSRARARRSSWENRAQALDFFRSKPMFNGWGEEFLHAYVKHGLMDAPHGGVTLLCPPEVEAQGFENYSPDVWSWPARLKTRTLIVQGVNSDVLLEPCLKKFCALKPDARSEQVEDANHFIPMQQPDRILALIRDFHRENP